MNTVQIHTLVHRMVTPAVTALLLFSGQVHATAETAVDNLLAMDTAPEGVLFEVVTGDEDALARLLPRAATQVARLHERFPGLEVVVLTHGSEQFALLTSAQREAPATHKAVRSLVADGVPVQVCGNHASWRDKYAEDFPDYVEVTSSASAQVSHYRARGFEIIRLRP
jgi:intracellular sulfur oxidation DsrE/DsrF family protein